MTQIDKAVLLRKHAFIVLPVGLCFSLVEVVGKHYLLGAVLLVMILALTLPIILLKERFNTGFAVSYLCIGTLFVAIVMEAALGMLTEMFPLYIACLVISGIYFEPKLVLRFGVVMNISLVGTMVLFWNTACANAQMDIVLKSILIMEITIFLVYMTVSWGNGFMQDAHNKAQKSEELVLDVQKKVEETNRLMERQEALLAQINEISLQVIDQSEQVSQDAQLLAQNTTQQVNVIETLKYKMEEIAQMVQDSAEKAKAANSFAEIEAKEMADCTEQMDNMMLSIEDIQESSRKIESIIKDIQDIASQTNILALNAAVEAARAGNSGKGFAVVADEVRSLAKKSADAAQSTAMLIESSIKAIGKGAVIAKSTSAALITLSEGSTSLTTVVDKIADSSLKQSTAISQTMDSIAQISSVVQSIANTADESATASGELYKQGRLLKEIGLQQE